MNEKSVNLLNIQVINQRMVQETEEKLWS